MTTSRETNNHQRRVRLWRAALASLARSRQLHVNGWLLLVVAAAAAAVTVYSTAAAVLQLPAFRITLTPSWSRAAAILALPLLGLVLTLILLVRTLLAFRRRSFGCVGQLLTVLVGGTTALLLAGILIPAVRPVPGQRMSDEQLRKALAEFEAEQAEARAARAEGRRLRTLNTAAVSPAPGSSDVPLDAVIWLKVDQPLSPYHPSTLWVFCSPDGSYREIPVAGALSIGLDRRTLRFIPDLPLKPGSSYRVQTADVPSLPHTEGGLPGSENNWRFTTANVDPLTLGIHARRLHLLAPKDGVTRVSARPGTFPSGPGAAPLQVWFEAERCRFHARSPLLTPGPDGSLEGELPIPGYAVTVADTMWAHVVGPDGHELLSFHVTTFADPDGISFWVPPEVEGSFTFDNGILIEVPRASFKVPAKITLDTISPDPLPVVLPPKLEAAAEFSFAIDFPKTPEDWRKPPPHSARSLSISVPAPVPVAKATQVFLAEPMGFAWEPYQALRLATVGGVRMIDGRQYLSFHPSVQPEPNGGTCAEYMARVGSDRGCVTREGNFAPLGKSSSRTLAVLYETDPRAWTILNDGGAKVTSTWGACTCYDLRAPHFVCRIGPLVPVLTGSSPEIEGRMHPTGWVCIERHEVGRIPVTTDAYVRPRVRHTGPTPTPTPTPRPTPTPTPIPQPTPQLFRLSTGSGSPFQNRTPRPGPSGTPLR